MKTDELVRNLTNALNAEAAQTQGKDITKLLTYNINLVIKEGQIVGYSIDRTENFTDSEETPSD